MGRRPAVAHPEGGFTLLELVVTLLVLALAVGIVLPTVGRSTDAIRGRAEVARFSAMLRHAREQAITTQRPHTFVVDPGTHRIAITAGADEVRETRALPADLVVQAEPPPALSVRFEPHGVSSGGAFWVTAGTSRYLVTVDALTGRVRAARR
jgi:prepilin-type N-terminal cleavage/methylation domain-containing protein